VSFSRRDFLERSAALAAAGFVPRLPEEVLFPSREAGTPPSTAPAFRGRPLVVSSSNGLKGVKVAYDKMLTGEDPLDAAIAGEEVILEPFEPSPNFTVAFILKDGAVIEYMKFDREEDLPW
jgi:N4-(beta-N-acetylglucosaminyl)-L-asparaginase